MSNSSRAVAAPSFALGVVAAIASFVVPFIIPDIAAAALLGPAAGVAAGALPALRSWRGLAVGYGGTVLVASIALTGWALGHLADDPFYSFRGSFAGFSGPEMAGLLWIVVPFYQLLTALTLGGYWLGAVLRRTTTS